MDIVFETGDTHLHPGRQGWIVGADPASGEVAARVVFAGGVAAAAVLKTAGDGLWDLEVGPHETSAGAAGRWRVALDGAADGRVRLRVEARLPEGDAGEADAGAQPPARSRVPLQAALALAAMLAFCMSDVLAKRLAPTIPPLEVVWFRYLGAVFVLAPVLLVLRARPRSAALGLQVVRSACMVVATTLLIAAIQRMPLAEATTLVFLSPILVVLLSALLLGEAIGRAQAVCVVAGLVGVVVIVRPDPAEMDMVALLPVAAAAFWATAMVLTRVVQVKGDTFLDTLVFTALVGFLVLTAALPFFFVMPSQDDVLLIGAMAACWLVAQAGGLAAYRVGRAADVAPFSYTQIVWAIVLGAIFFGELPDAMALLGCGIVIVSGVIASRLAPAARR